MGERQSNDALRTSAHPTSLENDMNNIEPSPLKKENRHISVLDRENPNKLPDNFCRPVPAKLIINTLPWLFSCLFKVYLKPLAKSSNVRVLSFTMFLSFLNVAAFLSDMPAVPEFSELKTTEGIIDFDTPTRRGTNLIILRKNNVPLILICAGGATINHDCINSEQQEKNIVANRRKFGGSNNKHC